MNDTSPSRRAVCAGVRLGLAMNLAKRAFNWPILICRASSLGCTSNLVKRHPCCDGRASKSALWNVWRSTRQRLPSNSVTMRLPVSW